MGKRPESQQAIARDQRRRGLVGSEGTTLDQPEGFNADERRIWDSLVTGRTDLKPADWQLLVDAVTFHSRFVKAMDAQKTAEALRFHDRFLKIAAMFGAGPKNRLSSAGGKAAQAARDQDPPSDEEDAFQASVGKRGGTAA